MKHSRKLAAVFPAVLLLNHACGAASNLSVPASAVSTTNQAEETNPVLATTAQESATPTEVALRLEVLEWHRWPEPLEEYDVERGWSYVYGLVRNPYEFAVEVAGTPTAKLFNSAGEFVYRSLGADLLDGSLMGSVRSCREKRSASISAHAELREASSSHNGKPSNWISISGKP